MTRLPPIIVAAPRGRVVRLRGLGATLPSSITSGGASTPVVPGLAASTTPTALPLPGAAPSTATAAAALQKAQTDWQNQVVAVIAAGDSYLNAGETAQALSTYQAAGNAGATSVGPEIDLIGYPQVSQPWTQKAWKLNALLSATTAVGDAQSYVKNMSLDYQIALLWGARQDQRPRRRDAAFHRRLAGRDGGGHGGRHRRGDHGLEALVIALLLVLAFFSLARRR